MQTQLKQIWNNIKEWIDDNIIWYIYDTPKYWLKSLRMWWFYNGKHKEHLNYFWTAFAKSNPFDNFYLYETQYLWLKKSIKYFEEGCFVISDAHKQHILKYQKLALAMLEIYLDKRETWTWDYDNNKYKCLVYVNMKTKDKYAYSSTDWENHKINRTTVCYDVEPHELYREKARQIYLRILKDYSCDWWD